jgi:uncharacterized membrane protein YfcA
VSDVFSLALIGASSGLLAGVCGLAGGIIIVPAMMWLYGTIALHDAITASWLMVFTNSLSAVVTQLRVRSIEERRELLRMTRWYLLGAALVVPVVAGFHGTHGGALRSVHIGLLQLCLAIVMMIPVRERDDEPTSGGALRDASVGGFVGGVSTLIGVGGGAYTTAYFVHAIGTRTRDALVAANLVGAVIGLVGICAYASAIALAPASGHGVSRFSPPAMASLAAAGVLAAPLGVFISRRMNGSQLRLAVVVFLLISAGRLVYLG